MNSQPPTGNAECLAGNRHASPSCLDNAFCDEAAYRALRLLLFGGFQTSLTTCFGISVGMTSTSYPIRWHRTARKKRTVSSLMRGWELPKPVGCLPWSMACPITCVSWAGSRLLRLLLAVPAASRSKAGQLSLSLYDNRCASLGK